MSKVTLKFNYEAVIGSRVLGTYVVDWQKGRSLFQGRTCEGKTSDWMKARELREWFAKECSK